MVEIILELIRINSGLIISVLLVIIAIFVAIIFITVVVQGREFFYGKLRIGGKHQVIKPIELPSETPQTEFDIDSIVEIVKERISEEESKKRIDEYVYKPEEPPERIIYLLSARYEIQRKIRSIVLSEGGPWMGASVATFETFLSLAESNQLIPGSLVEQISEFYLFTTGILNAEIVPDNEFEDVKKFAALISLQLDEIPLGPLGPEG